MEKEGPSEDNRHHKPKDPISCNGICKMAIKGSDRMQIIFATKISNTFLCAAKDTQQPFSAGQGSSNRRHLSSGTVEVTVIFCQ